MIATSPPEPEEETIEMTLYKKWLKIKLRQALKEVHSGGNGRRLLEEVLNDI